MPNNSSSNIILLLLLISLTGCDHIYRLLDKKGAEEKELIGVVTPLEVNPTVQEIQILLEIYGYDSGPADGVLGFKTRNALERFQQENGLTVSRHADAETWKKLKIFRDNSFVVDGELNVQLVQSILNKFGLNAGTEDGAFGARTKEAVIKFQKKHNLKADGMVGYKTLTELAGYIDNAENQP